MSKLTTKKRKALPKSAFAIPSKVKEGPKGGKQTRGAYPINDKAHARNACRKEESESSSQAQVSLHRQEAQEEIGE